MKHIALFAVLAAAIPLSNADDTWQARAIELYRSNQQEAWKRATIQLYQNNLLVEGSADATGPYGTDRSIRWRRGIQVPYPPAEPASR